MVICRENRRSVSSLPEVLFGIMTDVYYYYIIQRQFSNSPINFSNAFISFRKMLECKVVLVLVYIC